MSHENKSESRKKRRADSDSAHPVYPDIGLRILVTDRLLGCVIILLRYSEWFSPAEKAHRLYFRS